ncbi:MAG: DUF1700 domain-containing protein [Coprobacillaceae bacterium]
MSKKDFLKELSYLLQDISEDEREDALAYYEDYFDAAGEDNEAKVLAELQSPERVAALIKAGLNANFEETIEYSESSMGDSRYDKQHEVVIPNVEEKETYTNEDKSSEKRESKFRGNNNRNGFLIVLIIAAIFGLPFLGAGFGFFVAVVAIIFSFGIVIGALGFAAIVSAIAIFVKSLWMLGTYPAGSLVGIGLSLLLVALGVALFKNVKWPFKVVPELVKTVGDFVRNLIDKVGGKR